MFSKLRSLSVLYRYIFSYFLAILLPLGLLTSWLYNDNILYVRRDVEDMNLYRLKQAMDIFEARFKELHIIAYNIATDYRLKPDYLQESKYNVIEGVTSFNLHTRSSNFVDQMFLYFKDWDTVYAKDGIMDVYVLTNSFYTLNEEGEKSFYGQINSITVPSIIPARKVQSDTFRSSDVITYLYPLPLNSSQPYGILIFFIGKETITELMSDILGEYEGNALILDKDMTPIVSLGMAGLGIDKAIDVLGKHDDGKNGVFNQDGYSIIYTTSSSTGWKYVLSVPTEQFLIKVVRQRTLIFQIVLTVFILGIGIAVTLALINYKPIKRLLTVTGASNPKAKSNEIDRIENTVLTYINNNKELKRLIDAQVPYAKERILELLLDGKIKKEDAYQLLKEAGIRFGRYYYSVAVIDNYYYMDDSQRSRFHQMVLKVVEIMEQEVKHGVSDRMNYSICAIEKANETAITLVMNFSNRGDELVLADSFINKIKDVELNGLNKFTVLALGKTYASISELKKSFLEAMAVIEYTCMKRQYGIFMFDDIIYYGDTTYWYPVEEQLRFEQGLKQGDAETAIRSLGEICANISRRNNSTLMLKYVCFDIINSVIKIVTDIKLGCFTKGELDKIMLFNSLDQFRNGLEVIILEFCNSVNTKKMSNNAQLRDEILKYVKLHFREYNMSLETIAQNFSLSPYYVSRFFSEQTNCTLKDYITNLRIQEAKKLLTNSEFAINDIVEQIGYVNVSSFIRKFKKLEGLTPGEYRKIYG